MQELDDARVHLLGVRHAGGGVVDPVGVDVQRGIAGARRFARLEFALLAPLVVV